MRSVNSLTSSLHGPAVLSLGAHKPIYWANQSAGVTRYFKSPTSTVTGKSFSKYLNNASVMCGTKLVRWTPNCR